MKKLFTAIALIVSATTFAQNVGIGETAPTASKLQVKAADSAVLLIQNTASALNTKTALFYKSDNNYSGGIATIQTAPSFYRMGLFTFGGAAASGLKERMSILDDGNVGIGTINPTAKLEVAGTVKIADGTQGDNKVLTSDAQGNASWANTAYTNAERFYYRLSGVTASPNTLSTFYNSGTTTTTYTAGDQFFRINFTKSGLYHFDVNAYQYCSSDYSTTSSTPRTMEVNIGFATSIDFNGFSPFAKTTSGFSNSTYDKSFDIYITAPSSVLFYSVKLANNIIFGINVNGHLIAE